MRENKYKIEFDGQSFMGYLEFGYYLINRNMGYQYYPTNEMFTVREALETKFNRKFSFREVKKILNDKSWQWRTSSQVKEYLKERYGDAHVS